MFKVFSGIASIFAFLVSPAMAGQKTDFAPPQTREEAFAVLEEKLSAEDLQKIRQSESCDIMVEYHFSLGRWVRNNFDFGSEGNLSPLAKLYMGHDKMIFKDVISNKLLDDFCEYIRSKE